MTGQSATKATQARPATGPRMPELHGRVAIVTGGGGAIGSAIARTLSESGARVVVADLDPGAAERAAATMPGATAVRLDVADRESCRRVVAEVVAGHGGLDILINNAGLQFIAPIDEYPEERWEQLLRVMLFGPFYLTKDALPVMRRNRWGRIVNMGSIHSVVASVNKSAYTAAKHGLLGFTRATALEAAADGITVNCVCPTYVNTSLVTNQIAPQARTLGISEEQVVADVMLGPAAVKRFLEVDEVAALVRYLCSDAAAGITGSAQMIDGGWTAR